jgi:hypothetical protein
MKSSRRIPLTHRSACSLRVLAAAALLIVFLSVGPGLFRSAFASDSTVQAASWTSSVPTPKS